MAKARILVEETVVLSGGRFQARVKVIEVPKTSKFPDGIKVKCILLDVDLRLPRLLLDNHEP